MSPRQRKRRERRAQRLRRIMTPDDTNARQRKRRGQLRVQALRRALGRMTCPPATVHLYDRAGRVCDTIEIVTDDPRGTLRRAQAWLRRIDSRYRCMRLQTDRELESVIWLSSACHNMS